MSFQYRYGVLPTASCIADLRCYSIPQTLNIYLIYRAESIRITPLFLLDNTLVYNPFPHQQFSWIKKISSLYRLLKQFPLYLTMHSSDAFKALEIPQLNGHISRTGGQQFASVVKRNILHRVCMTLKGSFKVSRLIIPHLTSEQKIR